MIAAVVLTHNDSETIARTLHSLSWCDEIVVIDDHSSDNTREIVSTFTKKVFIHPLHNDFAAQRNFGLTKTSCDWVLFVDADEIVSSELAQEINQVIRDNHGQNGFYMKRIDWLWGKELKHGETANVRLLRLAKKSTGIWERPVHEVWHVDGDVGALLHPLLHYPHPNVAQFLDEVNRYSTLNAKHLYDQGVRAHFMSIAVYPVAKFFVNYVVRLGFLDGMPGAILAIMMSFHSFLTRAKLWQLAQKPPSIV